MKENTVMTEEQVRKETAKMTKLEPGLYLMGTTAYHLLGNISSDVDDLFYASFETDGFYIGSWITGFGFINVCFPKETSRKLTPEEIEKYNKTFVQISSQPPVKLNVS
jgi:hypothetical protein